MIRQLRLNGIGKYRLWPFATSNPNGDLNAVTEAFSHAGEVATAGYYSVQLGSPSIQTELTATLHSAMARFTYPATTNADLVGIVDGPDGHLWIADSTDHAIISLNPLTHASTAYPLSAADNPWAITVGPDGNLWFTDIGSNSLGVFALATHKATEFAIPTFGAKPLAITAGPDGNLWFTESQTGRIGSINPKTDTIAEYRLCLDKDPRHAPAYYDLGILYSQERKTAEAKEAFENYLKYGVHEDAASRKDAEERLKTFSTKYTSEPARDSSLGITSIAIVTPSGSASFCSSSILRRAASRLLSAAVARCDRGPRSAPSPSSRKWATMPAVGASGIVPSAVASQRAIAWASAGSRSFCFASPAARRTALM